MNKIIVFLPLQ